MSSASITSQQVCTAASMSNISMFLAGSEGVAVRKLSAQQAHLHVSMPLFKVLCTSLQGSAPVMLLYKDVMALPCLHRRLPRCEQV